MSPAGILLWTARWAPPERRDWIEALAAEADVVPPGPQRWGWLAGGLWLVAKEARMIRKLAFTAVAVAAAAVLIRFGWHDHSHNPAIGSERFIMIAVAGLLTVAPWLVAVADNPAARRMRVLAYGALSAFFVAMVLLSRYAGARFDSFEAADPENWTAEMRSGVVVEAVIIIGMFGAYAAAILYATSRRAAAVPRTLALGGGYGAAVAVLAYALTPFGGIPHLPSALSVPYGLLLFLGPIALLMMAGRSAADPRQGCLAGLYAGGVAVLLLGALTIITMVAFPHMVPLKWANPSPLVEHGTDFEWRMSVGDGALKYQVFLLLGPVVGLFFAAIGASFQREQPDELPVADSPEPAVGARA